MCVGFRAHDRQAGNSAAGPADAVLQRRSGLVKLAEAHVAQCLVADTDVRDRELTRKDRLALAFAPRLSADVQRAVPTDAPTTAGCDPIVALLEGSQDTDSGSLVVSTRLDLGPRATPAAEF